MPKLRLKQLSIQVKIAALSAIVLIFALTVIATLKTTQKKVEEKNQFLSEIFIKKTQQLNSSQQLLNSFIVFNHISYNKLDDFIDLQNSFFQTIDSINIYLKQYKQLTTNFTENESISTFETEFQKLQNIIYEIFNQYKSEEINLKNISRLFNKELIAYQRINTTINHLKTQNNQHFNKSIQEIQTDIHKNTIKIIIIFIIFLSTFIFLLLYFFNETIKTTQATTKQLEKLSKGEYNKLDLPTTQQNAKSFQYLTDINNNYNTINTYINNLIEENYNLNINDTHNTVIKSINKLSSKLIKSQKELGKRQKEDEQKEWANNGINLFSDLMRQNSNNLKKLTDEVIKNFVKYLKASVGGLFITQEENTGKHLELISAFAYDRKKYYSRKINFGEGLIGTAAIDMTPIYINEIPQDYLDIESGLGDAPPNNILILPLMTDNGILGVIEIASFRNLEQHEINFAENLSRSIASTIESVKINARTIDLLKESQKKSDTLAQREKILQDTMDEVSKAHETARKNEIETKGILSGVDQTLMRAEYLPNGTFINSNLVHRRVMGYNIDKMKDKNILEFIQDSERITFKKMWDEVANGKPYQITVKRQNQQTGNEVWLLNQYTPIKDDAGKTIKILYLAIDITEQKIAEEKANKLLSEAQEKENELQGILSGIDKTILRAEYTPDGIFINSNKVHQNIIGYNKKTMIGKSILEFVPDTERDQFIKFWQEIKTGKSKELIANRINKQTGSLIWLLNQYTPIKDDKGQVTKILYFAIDITEQKQTEQKVQKLLRESSVKENELTGLFKGIDQTLIRAEYTSDGDLINANKLHRATFGYNIEKMKGKNIIEFVHETTERKKLIKIWENVQNGKLEQLTVKRKNKKTNETIWLLNQYTPIANEKGQINKILYLAIDITEQKLSEQKSQKLLKEARNKEIEITNIFKAIDHSIIRAEITINGQFIEINKEFENKTGIEKQNIIGKTYYDIATEKQAQDYKNILKQTTQGQTIQIQHKITNKKTNKTHWLLSQYSPILNEEEKIIKTLYLGIDITEQKTAEQKIQELLQDSKQQQIELSSILESVDQTLMRAEYTPEGNFINANEIHQKIMGYNKKNMINKNIIKFIPENEKETFKTLWENVINGKSEQTTVKRKNIETNKEIWLLNQYTPVKNENNKIIKIQYLAIDITEQKIAEQKIQKLLQTSKQNENKLTELITSIDKTILRAEYTPEGNLTMSNKIHQQTLNYNFKDRAGQNITKYIEENQKENFIKIFNNVTQGNVQKLITEEINKKTGAKIWLQNNYIPIMKNQKIEKILYYAIDISKQKRLEQELLIQKKVLNQNMDELFMTYEKMENEITRLKKIETNITEKYDTTTDKAYNNWINNFF